MLVTGQLVVDLVQGGTDVTFELQIAIWLWLTVLFANFSEALAEGRGKAQADALRRTRTTTVARRLDADGQESPVPAPDLRAGDVVVCEAGDTIPGDGDIVEGIASVDESAITGESAPVIREAGGDRSAVTGGTRVLSDRIVVAHHGQPRRELPRPHDRPGRGRDPPAHAERDRPLDPARGPLADLRRGLRLAAGHGALRRHDADPGGAGGAVRRAHPDHHRRAAVGHRHRRHEPARAPQRAGDLRPRGRGGRRRVGAAARQDRDDHARQPPGGALPARRAASRSASSPRPRSSRRWPTRRPRGARSSSWPRSASTCASTTSQPPARASSRSRRRRA